MLRPGVAVDRYVVDVEIGRGGMAVVYRVHHRTLGSTHALKVLYLPSPDMNERVMQEGRIQASLRHTNVVAVTDVVDVEGAPGLIMDYVDGDNLEVWLEKGGRELDEVIIVFRQVVAGVRAAHDRGLVHRDLKPANVLMSRVEGQWRPMITDFGLAKAVSSVTAGSPTRSNMSMGTPSYMAPEQIRNARAVDQRADVFSLGALLYRMVVGVQPFHGADVLEVMLATAEGAFVPPEEARPELPDRLARVISACLAPDPNRRLESCERLIAALDGQVELDELWAKGAAGQGNLTLSPMSFSDRALMAKGGSGPSDPPSSGAPYDGPQPISLAPEDLVPPARQPRGSLVLLAVLFGALLVILGVVWWAPPEQPVSETPVEPAPVAPFPVADASEAPPVAPEPPVAPAEIAAPEEGEVRVASAASHRARPSSGAAIDPAAAPAPSAPTPKASVSAVGDAAEVWLESAGRRVPITTNTSVDPGVWQIHARFEGAPARNAGRAVLSADTTVTISCSSAFGQCRPRVQP